MVWEDRVLYLPFPSDDESLEFVCGDDDILLGFGVGEPLVLQTLSCRQPPPGNYFSASEFKSGNSIESGDGKVLTLVFE